MLNVRPTASAATARHLSKLIGAATLLAAGAVSSAPLPELWQATQQHAPALASAQAARQAGQSRDDQARALWRPDVVISGSAGYGRSSSLVRGAQFSAPGFGSAGDARFETEMRNAHTGSWNVALVQPLYSPQRSAQRALLNISSASAELQWQSARQALMLQLAEAYFGQALAERQSVVLRRQQQSVDRILAEVRERHELGDLPITDIHEAQAQADDTRARRLAAETALDLRQTQLADLIGQRLPLGKALLPTVQPKLPTPDNLEDWQAQAMQHNPQLLLMEKQIQSATQELARHGPLSGAQVDLVARTGSEHIHGNHRSASLSRQSWVGVQFNLPLSTSGLRSAQKREAAHLADQARAEHARKRQDVARQVRAAWLELNTGRSRIQALEAGTAATASRLAATRQGVAVGDRRTQDLLDAEYAHAAAQLALDEARVAWVLHRLQLEALAGQLNEDGLHWAWQQTSRK